jgi:hypothetical protein
MDTSTPSTGTTQAAAGAAPRLTGESLEMLKSFAGNQAAILTMELMSEESKLRYRSFYPCGDMLIGLRYHEPNPDRKSFKMGRSLKIVDGKIVTEPRRDVMFTPPLVPHHSEHVYGFWHINDQQEMAINMKLDNERRLTVLVEGFPRRGRVDRFAWYCLECLNPLFMTQVETARVGLGGYYAAQEDAFGVFNNDVRVRTCSACGAVHPIAYSIFPWKDSPEEAAARQVW